MHWFVKIGIVCALLIVLFSLVSNIGFTQTGGDTVKHLLSDVKTRSLSKGSLSFRFEDTAQCYIFPTEKVCRVYVYVASPITSQFTLNKLEPRKSVVNDRYQLSDFAIYEYIDNEVVEEDCLDSMGEESTCTRIYGIFKKKTDYTFTTNTYYLLEFKVSDPFAQLEFDIDMSSPGFGEVKLR